MVKTHSLIAAVFGGVVLSALPVLAAGSFDGAWDVKIVGAGNIPSGSGVFECPASVITLTVKNGNVSGSLERAPDGQIRDGYDGSATPVTGTIDESGKLTAIWQNFAISGQATRNHLSIAWKGECGQRNGVGHLF